MKSVTAAINNAARNKNSAAFKQKLKSIFIAYQDKIYGLALSICRNPKDAEDITQNTFSKIILNLDKFRGQSNIATWIYRISYNEALMFLRKKRRDLRLQDNIDYHILKDRSAVLADWPLLPDDLLVNKELHRKINSSIQRLDLKYRLPLLLHHVHGLAIKEAAKVLDIKANSFKTRLHRAYLMLRGELTAYFADAREEKIGFKTLVCDRSLKFIYDYSCNKLGSRQRLRFDQHIKDCRPCRSFLNDYQQAIKITQSLQCRDLPEALREKLKTLFT
ncbi:MAG: sigma-70 family RNA polymerase sigma factor [Candidatus Omnitrophica bacterium]|nr:sigma-70 family RNA polymerase sigma factor [Candidatus Omnitrophota bacterium]